MKPRLDPAPLTRADKQIWSFVSWKIRGNGGVVWSQAESADRRDADLMLRAQMHVHFYGGDEYGHGRGELDGIAICGQLER